MKILLLLFVIALFTIIVGTFGYFSWTDTNLEFVLTNMLHKKIVVPDIISSAFAIITGGFGLLFNLIVGIVR